MFHPGWTKNYRTKTRQRCWDLEWYRCVPGFARVNFPLRLTRGKFLSVPGFHGCWAILKLTVWRGDRSILKQKWVGAWRDLFFRIYSFSEIQKCHLHKVWGGGVEFLGWRCDGFFFLGGSLLEGSPFWNSQLVFLSENKQRIAAGRKVIFQTG